MLNLEPWTLFWTVFNVLVLFLALKKFLVKPVMGVIEQRDMAIKQQFEDAKKVQLQAETMKSEYEKQLETAQSQVEEMILSARVRAEEEHNQMIAQTKQESARMLEQAKVNIKYEQEKAQQELRSQIGVLALAAARKIIKTGEIHDTGSNE